MDIFYDDILSNGRTAYNNFAKLHNILYETIDNDINLFVSSEGRFGRTFLFLLMCIKYFCMENKKRVNIKVKQKTFAKLLDSSFISPMPTVNLGFGNEMHFVLLDDNVNIVDHAKRIVKNMPVEMSLRLHEDMISRIGEIFNNARGHSEAKYVIAGRYRKRNKTYCFSCYDTGIGMPEKVRAYMGNTISDKEALYWALQRFNSTEPVKIGPRGLGLNLLQEFTRVNYGIIRICTGRILYTYNCKRDGVPEEKYEDLSYNFFGTLFEMDINADDRHYQYGGELV